MIGFGNISPIAQIPLGTDAFPAHEVPQSGFFSLQSSAGREREPLGGGTIGFHLVFLGHQVPLVFLGARIMERFRPSIFAEVSMVANSPT
jgi:hypothetical protein